MTGGDGNHGDNADDDMEYGDPFDEVRNGDPFADSQIIIHDATTPETAPVPTPAPETAPAAPGAAAAAVISVSPSDDSHSNYGRKGYTGITLEDDENSGTASQLQIIQVEEIEVSPLFHPPPVSPFPFIYIYIY